MKTKEEFLAAVKRFQAKSRTRLWWRAGLGVAFVVVLFTLPSWIGPRSIAFEVILPAIFLGSMAANYFLLGNRRLRKECDLRCPSCLRLIPVAALEYIATNNRCTWCGHAIFST